MDIADPESSRCQFNQIVDADLMAPAFSIDRSTGSIRVGDIASLEANQQAVEVAACVGDLVNGSRDHGNGFAWLYLRDLTFGGQSAHLSLCFHNSLLESASWSVQLPDAVKEDGWPTRDAIDAELAFVRRTLNREMSISLGRQAWGEVWSSFDAKAFIAGNKLRYALG